MAPGTSLTSLSRMALSDAVSEHAPAWRAAQIYRWLYHHGVRSWDGMTNVPVVLRTSLSDSFCLDGQRLVTEQQSRDKTIKMLFELPSGNQFETVLIPDFDRDGAPRRMTVCVSSQVGCAMGCTFCATGRMGFQENLSSGDIFDQVWWAGIKAREHFGMGITNVVFMGMGEPLLNTSNVLDAIEKLTAEDGLGLGARRITVSTVGLAGRIRSLADDGFSSQLAVSLHAPTQDKRSAIMPVNRSERTDLAALVEAIVYFTNKTGSTVTYEYCMFHGHNDSLDDADALAGICAKAPSKVNLIMYNPVDGLGFDRTPEHQLNAFIERLVSRGVTVTVRRSRGQDIDAACGQLAAKNKRPSGPALA